MEASESGTAWGGRPFAWRNTILKAHPSDPPARHEARADPTRTTYLLLLATVGTGRGSYSQSLRAEIQDNFPAPPQKKARADTCVIRPDLNDRNESRLYPLETRPYAFETKSPGHPPVLSEVIKPSNACFSCSSGMMMVGLTRMSSTLSPLIFDRLV